MKLGPGHATLLTIGSVVGSGIFLVTGDMARALPHAGLILLAWIAGGAVVLAGTVTYAELGTMHPKAGGPYHFLREAYGPFPGFLYGWTCFLVIMSGGIAALAAAFGEYLGGFLPFFSTKHELLRISGWTLSGGQIGAIASILVLTAVNHAGLGAGARVQSGLTVLKLASVLLFVALAFMAPAPALESAPTPVPAGWITGFGIAIIATLWTYDGWNSLTFTAGELREPSRHLPLGMIGGMLAVVAAYLLVNLAYVRVLSVDAIAASPRVGEAAALALFGSGGARLLSAAVLVSIFGCLCATILYSSRIYGPMAQDGLFFRSLAGLHPVRRVPTRSLWAQSGWAALLVLTGTYEQLYTYVTFAVVLFQAGVGAAIFVLRRRQPDRERPYRAWGYPVVPALFVLASAALAANVLAAKPRDALFGLGLIALGAPAYFFWRRRRMA